MSNCSVPFLPPAYPKKKKKKNNNQRGTQIPSSVCLFHFGLLRKCSSQHLESKNDQNKNQNQEKKKTNHHYDFYPPWFAFSPCSMPQTGASGDAFQSASQSLEVADILLLQEKAKSMAQTEHKKNKASSALHSAPLSKPPNSSSSSDDDTDPAQEPSSVCQSASALPTSIPDPHGAVEQTDPRSPSGSSSRSPTRQLHKPKKHKKPMVTSNSNSSSDPRPPKCTYPKRQNAHLQNPSTKKSFKSCSNCELTQHLEAMPVHLPARCQKQQWKLPPHCQKVILLLQLTNIYPSTSSN